MLVTKDLQLIYKNEIGREIELSFSSDYTLQNVTEELENTITTYKQSLIHGTKYISNSLEERHIIISGIIQCNNDSENLISNLIRTFNTTISGTLTAITSSTQRHIEVYVENMPNIEKEDGVITYSINLVAQSPFWENEIKTEYLALLMPCLKFPLNIPKNKGMAFGRRRSILESDVDNVGDVESGFKVIFTAKGGTVISPKIYNVFTEQFIKINCKMEKGDTLEVINYPELKSIKLNGENAFKYLDIESEFFNLEIGFNKIGYIAEQNTINLDVILWYAPRFLGVS